MKGIKEFWKTNEQWLSFLAMVVYLNGFWMVFVDEMREGEWITGLWLVQFFTLATLYSVRSRVKGWKLPKNIKDTH